MIRLFFAVTFSVLSLFVYAQSTIAPKDPNAPGVASIGTIWSPDIALYTGTAKLNIPLYDIECYGYKLPISLGYSYNGFRYGDLSSIVGLHWDLDIPIITRNVVDKDDFDAEKGYLNVPYDQRNIDKSDMPDIFTLHTPEGNARFIFKQKGRGRDNYEGEIVYQDNAGFTINYRSDIREITAVSSKGTVYLFAQPVYTTTEVETQPQSSNAPETYVTTWYPTTITMENLREISFDYTVSQRKIYTENGNIGKVLAYYPPAETLIESAFTAKSKMKTDEVSLNSITWDHGRLSFSYSSREDHIYQDCNRLSQVELFDNANVSLRLIKLEQNYFANAQGGQKRMRLDKILDYGNSISNVPLVHSFKYKDQSLPNYDPVVKVFGFDSVFTETAALKTVEYPTGLRTVIDYERNAYDPTLINNSTPDVKHLGYRVKSLSNYSKSGVLLTKKEYVYQREDGNSSGRILSRINTNLLNTGIYYFLNYSNWTPPTYQFDVMGYSDVLVSDVGPYGEWNGATRYIYLNNPSTSYYVLQGSQSDYDFRNGRLMEKHILEGSKIENLRLVEKEWYAYDDFRTETNTIPMYYVVPGTFGPVQNSKNVLRVFKSRLERIATFKYKYDANANATNNLTTVDYYFSLDDYLDYRDFLPLSRREYKGGLARATYFKYPYHFENRTNSRGDKSPASSLRDKSTVVEEIIKNSSFQIIGANLTDYKATRIGGRLGMIQTRPSRIYELELDQPLTNLIETRFSSTEIFPADPNYNLKYSGFKYDMYGNVTEVIDNGISTSYVYGYAGKYILAKCEGLEYQLVVDILGENTLDELNSVTATESTINNALALIRSDTRAKKALITSYSYRPLVGMKSMIDPNGLKMEYRYDGFNRLIEIRDLDGKVLKSYQYNYKGN